jgi:hypothetical protein
LLKYSEQQKNEWKRQRYADEIKWLVSNPERNDFIKKLVFSTKGNTLVLFNYVELQGKPLAALLKAEAKDRPVFSSMEKQKRKPESIFGKLWTMSKMQYSLLVTGLRVLALTSLTSIILFLLLPLSLLLGCYRVLVEDYVSRKRKKH